ncbi:MAG: nucleotide pyrophosphohydrolase [Bacilli bacterium]|nr:nucleotide pyrophosphohydrolase [Bacilli bacterium]
MEKQKNLYSKLNSNMDLNEIQDYIKKVIEIRGFGNQPIEQAMLLLVEEVGELAKAIRKEKTNMCIDKSKINNYDTVEGEIADVFIVLNTVCNLLNINLYDVFYAKEKVNVERSWKNDNKNS